MPEPHANRMQCGSGFCFYKFFSEFDIEHIYSFDEYARWSQNYAPIDAVLTGLPDDENRGFTISSARRSASADSAVQKIIDEQLDLFIADAQTAEETAENVQRKVSIFLKEIK